VVAVKAALAFQKEAMTKEAAKAVMVTALEAVPEAVMVLEAVLEAATERAMATVMALESVLA